MYAPIRCLTFAALLASFTSAHAGFTVVSGNLTLIDAPATVSKGDDLAGMPQSYTHIFGFQERENHVLTADLGVDAVAAGLYGAGGILPIASTISAGTALDSYYFHSDPFDGAYRYTATVKFDRKILGIQFGKSTIMAADAEVGAAGTSYFAGVSDAARALEFGQDWVRWIDDNTLEMSFRTSSRTDEIRVLAAAVPGPAGAATMLIGLLGMARRRRSR